MVGLRPVIHVLQQYEGRNLNYATWHGRRKLTLERGRERRDA